MRIFMSTILLVSWLLTLSIASPALSQTIPVPVPVPTGNDTADLGCVDCTSQPIVTFSRTSDGGYVEMDLPFIGNSLLIGYGYSNGLIVALPLAKSDLEKCIDNVNTAHPKPTKGPKETEEKHQQRLKQWRIDWRNAAEKCMKANKPDAPFKPKKNSGEKKAPWTDKGGRKWEPHQDANHSPHWDVTPALPKPKGTKGDTWEQDGCTLTDKGTYTTVYPKWSK